MDNVNNCGKSKTGIYVVVILATLLLMAFLVNKMTSLSQPAPVGAERAAARAKDNADIRAAGASALESWGFVDQPKGIVRLPIQEAMKLTVDGYQKPAVFHKDLVARTEKANAAAPKPPEVKSEFE